MHGNVTAPRIPRHAEGRRAADGGRQRQPVRRRRPKQFFSVAGKPVLRHAAERLLAEVDFLLPVGEAGPIAEALAGLPHLPPVNGGGTRQESVRRGLEALAPHRPEIVMVHDGCRPFIPPGTVPALLAALRTRRRRDPGGAGGRHAQARARRRPHRRDGAARRAVPRADAAGVPVCRAARPALSAPDGATDDAAILEHAGHPVALIPGHEDNIKMTFPDDAARLERILAPVLLPRVGTGFDVHVLEAGRRLVLCGVEVAHDKGLAGHSDADVGIHALCDAIYGALAEGDIGRIFLRPKRPGRTRILPVPGPRGRQNCRPRRSSGERRRHADLRTPEDHPARATHDFSTCRNPRRRPRPDFGEGDDHRAPRLHRADGGDCRTGRGDGADNGVRRRFWRSLRCAII